MTERACIFLLGGPLADAVGMVGMVACSPGNHAGLVVGNLVCLALQASLVDTILADGTVLYCYVPAPEGNCVPLLDLNSFIDLHGLVD